MCCASHVHTVSMVAGVVCLTLCQAKPVGTKNNNGAMPLHLAAEAGAVENVECLISHGAGVLHLACTLMLRFSWTYLAAY